MKNILLLSLLFSFSFIGHAQQLESKIPEDALMIASIDGSHLQDFVSVSELNNFNFMKEFFKNNSDSGINNVENFGFDLNSDAYYFYQADSIKYHNIIVKLDNKTHFEDLLTPSDKDQIIRENGINMIIEPNEIFVWNDSLFYFTHAEFPYNPYAYNPYDYEYEDVEEAVEPVYQESESIEVEPRIEDSEEMFTIEKEEVDVTEDNVKEDDLEEEIIDQIDNQQDDTAEVLKQHALNTFRSNTMNSPVFSSSYKSGKDKDAVAYFWVKNYGKLMGSFLGSAPTMPFSLSADVIQNMYGIEAFKANLFIEEDEMRTEAVMEVNDSKIDFYKKLYKNKLSSSFYKYFDQDKALAYVSVASNTQATLEELPNLYASIMGGMMPTYKEEAALGMDFLSILLDEEAIGKLITGNLLFVLNDLGEKEVTYTTYEYDEEWNSKEITKTKMEVVPDFTLIFGSENPKFMNKLIALGAKHNVIDRKKGFFELLIPNSASTIIPKLYVQQKDGLLFISTQEKEMLSIASNQYKANTGNHKKMMKKNIMAMYVNSTEILSKIPTDSLNSSDLDVLDYAQKNLTDVSFTTSRLKGNKLQMEYKMKTSGKEDNALKLMLSFIDSFSK